MSDFMRDLLGSAWAYYVAIGILVVWFIVERKAKK